MLPAEDLAHVIKRRSSALAMLGGPTVPVAGHLAGSICRFAVLCYDDLHAAGLEFGRDFSLAFHLLLGRLGRVFLCKVLQKRLLFRRQGVESVLVHDNGAVEEDGSHPVGRRLMR